MFNNYIAIICILDRTLKNSPILIPTMKKNCTVFRMYTMATKGTLIININKLNMYTSSIKDLWGKYKIPGGYRELCALPTCSWHRTITNCLISVNFSKELRGVPFCVGTAKR